MNLKTPFSLSRVFFSTGHRTQISSPARTHASVLSLNLSTRFENASWTIESKDKSGRKIAPFPFINQNGLSFINGYRQVIISKLSNLGLNEIPTSSLVASSKFFSTSEPTDVILGRWLCILAKKFNNSSDSLSYQYISQALNLELFFSSLSQQRTINPDALGMPSISDLHDAFSSIPEPLINSIGRSFGTVEEFKKTFESVGLAFFGGSGWLWLVENRENQLKIIITLQSGTPFIFENGTLPKSLIQWPILGVSLWEHSYLPTHSFNRAVYLNAFWSAINWNEVSSRLGAKFIQNWKINHL